MDELKVQPPVLYDLTTVGDAFVELRASEGTLPEAHTFEKHLGGSAAHIAIYHVMLGGRAACIAAVGADAHGTFVQNTLRQYKVNAAGLQFTRDHPTTLLFTVRAGRFIQSSWYRLADWQLHNTKDHVTLATTSRFVHGTGLCLWKHPARHSVFEMLRMAKKWDIRTVLQPAYEPALWRDRADAQATIKKTLQFADIVTPTFDDAEHLFGKQTKEDYLRLYHDMGAKTVILTMGKAGCIVSDGGKGIRIPAVDAPVIDPGGINDAWHAALYYALAHGKPLANAAYVGNIVAAYVLQQPGSLVPLPPIDEITQKLVGKSFEEI
jgi:sugar/nucleoside kinase (ribokinase family)